jgi:hypothetical protein
MQKVHVHEAILLVNRGVDEAVSGLEHLKRAKGSQPESACFDEELMLFEDHREWLNCHFCSTVQRLEQQDSIRFENRHRRYERNTLDEVQLDRDAQIMEDRRRLEEKPPKVRFFTPAEQREWERQYLNPPDDAESEPHRNPGEQS